MPQFNHVEAFCLMKYASRDGSEVEWIWNSRDGVTPFGITSRSGQEMAHVDWNLDRRLPDYRPLPGERIFVDMTPELAEPRVREYVDKYWEDPEAPMSRHGQWKTKEEAVAYFVAEWSKPGRPTLIEARDWKDRPDPPARKVRFA